MGKTIETMTKLLRERLELSEEVRITPESNLHDDLGADSLDRYELVYAVEEELGISIPDEKAVEFVTVKDFVDYVDSQLSSSYKK